MHITAYDLLYIIAYDLLPPLTEDQLCICICTYVPPKNGVIALWSNTRVVKCKYYVSQKQNGFNNKICSYSILLTFIFKFTARLLWTKIFVPGNLSKDGKTTRQY